MAWGTRTVISFALIGALVAALVAAAYVWGADDGAYKAENLRLLGHLPVVPGSQQIKVANHGVYRERGPLSRLPVGWTTTVTFRAPAGWSADDVINYYLSHLEPGWQAQVEETPVVDLLSGAVVGRSRHALLTLEEARGEVNVDNMQANGPHTFEVSLDHAGLRHP
jgi:hypothetical protein